MLLDLISLGADDEPIFHLLEESDYKLLVFADIASEDGYFRNLIESQINNIPLLLIDFHGRSIKSARFSSADRFCDYVRGEFLTEDLAILAGDFVVGFNSPRDQYCAFFVKDAIISEGDIMKNRERFLSFLKSGRIGFPDSSYEYFKRVLDIEETR